MPALTASAAQLIEHQAESLPVGEIAAYLQDAIGQRVAAGLAGLDNAEHIGRYANEDEPNLQPATAQRLRAGYKIVRMLVEAYDAKTTQAWLFGRNTQLDGDAPIEVVAAATGPNELSPVVGAARQVASLRS